MAARSELAAEWAATLDAGLVDHSVLIEPSGEGTLTTHVHWPPAAREKLTDHFSRCVNELWACLDAAVAETVEMFSVLTRPRNPERTRYFPVADSKQGFESLLEGSCLDGILSVQYQLVRDCQPYQSSARTPGIADLRQSVRQLTDWAYELNNGVQMSAWATPVAPKVHVEAPILIEEIRTQDSGELLDEHIAASFSLSKYSPGANVFGQAGTYVDLCFSPGFVPNHLDDTFDHRLGRVIIGVKQFMAIFAALSEQVPGARKVLPPIGGGPSIKWISANQSTRHWTGNELRKLANSELGLGTVTEAEELTLLVSTGDGVYERPIPNASPLRNHGRNGLAAESAVQDAAATWGLPDFVLRPMIERKGAGVREISDGLIVVGKLGAIVQVKAREVEPRSAERESLWLTKQIRTAASQVHGTARRLAAGPLRMTNGRAREVTVDGPGVAWVGVVIVEHPDPPAFRVPALDGDTPVVVLLRRDWEFLFGQLKSSHALISYLHRVAESTEVLGEEPHRYYELASKDAIAEPAAIDPALLGRGQVRSVPLLPYAPAGTGDEEAHAMIRMVCEDIATTKFDEVHEDRRVRVLASIDSAPVGHRTDLGRLLLDSLQQARRVESGTTMWRSRILRASDAGDQLGFAVCSTLDNVTLTAFRAWTELRHDERKESEDITKATSIGVLLTPCNNGKRPWDTTMISVSGDLELSDEALESYRAFWDAPEAAG